MKQITFRELQTNTKWLNDLPVEVVRYGKVVCVVGVSLNESSKSEKIIQNIKKPLKTKEDAIKVSKELTKNESVGRESLTQRPSKCVHNKYFCQICK